MSVEVLENGVEELAPVWRALADGTRRDILDLLRDGPMTTGELSARFELSRFGVMKHLNVLAECGLVIVRREGRQRFNRLNPVPIQQIYRRWIKPFEADRADALLRLKQAAEQEGEVSTTAEAQFRTLDIQLEVRIAAPRKKVWKALTSDLQDWWPAEFYVGDKPKGFGLEPKVGGRVFEDWGDGAGALWGTVNVYRENEVLQWTGDMDASHAGPARTITTFELEDDGENTVLKFRDTPFGRLADTAVEHIEQGWKWLLEGSLLPWVVEGKRPERPATVK